MEPRNWYVNGWSGGSDASRATRITAPGSAGDRSQWYIIAVDRTVPGVDVDETAQRFVYVPVPPPPPPPSRVTGVRVSPLDSGLRVSYHRVRFELRFPRRRSPDRRTVVAGLVRMPDTEGDYDSVTATSRVSPSRRNVTVTWSPGR